MTFRYELGLLGVPFGLGRYYQKKEKFKLGTNDISLSRTKNPENKNISTA